MHSQFALFLFASVAFSFGFQMAVAQSDDDEIWMITQDVLDELNAVKKKIVSGAITRESLAADPYSADNRAVKEILDVKVREQRIKDNGKTKRGTKALNDAYAELVKLLESKHIEYEMPLDPTLKFILDEITTATKLVEGFDPKTKAFTAKYEWIARAISKKDREVWAKSFFNNLEDYRPRFYKELDKLAKACETKLNLYKPKAEAFTYHNDQEEKLIKTVLPDLATLTIHKTGIANKDWEVQKNALDVPEKRFKRAYIWAKNSKDDFSYCRLYQVNIIQDYQGGGKYASSKAVLIDASPLGCP